MMQIGPVLESYRPPMISSLKLTKFNLGRLAPQLGGACSAAAARGYGGLVCQELPVCLLPPPHDLLAQAHQVQPRPPGTAAGRCVHQPVGKVDCRRSHVSFGGNSTHVSVRTYLPFPCFGRGVCSGDQDRRDGDARAALTWWRRGRARWCCMRKSECFAFPRIDVVETRADEVVLHVDFNWVGDPSIILAIKTVVGVALQVQANSVNPLWNHSFEFTVEDAETQRLVIKVWDDQELTASLPVGQAAIVLADLPPLKLVDRWVPVVKDVDDPKADTRPRGSLHMELLYRPVDENGVLLVPSAVESPQNIPPLSMLPTPLSQLHLELLYRPVDENGLHLELLYRPVDENGLLLAPAYFTPPAPKTLQEATAAANAAEARKTRQAGVGFLSPIKAQQQEEGEGGGDVPAMALGGDLGGVGVEDGETKYMRGVLQVALLSGRELMACDMNGLSDPFAVLELQLGGQRRKSRVVKKTLEPEWNENFEFLVEDGKHDMLVVALFDHDLLGKK
ncbi:unnamed protein product, partial [Closterium sp. NIES-54]